MSQRRYPVSARNWFTLDTVELVFNTLTATYNGSHGIYAPAEYSFHCQNVNNFRNALLVPRAQNATQWRILFTDFQVRLLEFQPRKEPFNNQGLTSRGF